MIRNKIKAHRFHKNVMIDDTPNWGIKAIGGVIGIGEWKGTNGPVALYRLSSRDQNSYKDIWLKDGEIILQYGTELSLVKINLYKGLAYFIDETQDEVKFVKKGLSVKNIRFAWSLADDMIEEGNNTLIDAAAKFVSESSRG